MAAWVFLAFAFASVDAEPAPALTLVWHDSARLFPQVGLALLAEEMETLFRENGLAVRFRAAAENENLRTIPEPRVNALVIPREDWRLGLPRNTMAATLGESGKKQTIFVFYPGVRRTLGHREGDTSPRHLAELSRALARVVAHEVVHVLVPERGHAASGLMSESLGRMELLAEAIDLDGPSRESASAALAEQGCGSPGSKFPIPAESLRSIVQPEVPTICPCGR